MSIQDGKVNIYISRKYNKFIVAFLVSAQLLLSVVLSISLAANIIWPEKGSAVAGSPMQISYEGRLTDSSGNALGGTGTLYCYRFSIYDAVSGGNQLWPAGTPSNSTATTTDGVFNAVIGSADTLSSTVFDFSTTSTAYLQIEVNTVTSTCGGSWEALSPRQSILSSGYSLQSANVYGSLLKTDTVNGRVQVGTGSGAPTPVYLGLDVRNSADYVGQSCSTNGLMWYNSVTTQALICNAGSIQRIGTTATTTIAAINANSGTSATSGTVVFSNSNGVTFGINNNTITASVGGGGNTLSLYQNYPGLVGTVALNPSQSTSVIFPFNISNPISGSYIRMPVSMSAASTSFATTANTTFSMSQLNTFNIVIYSLGTGASSQSLQSVASVSTAMSQQYSLQANANGSQYTVTMRQTFPAASGVSGTASTTFAFSNGTFQISTGSISVFTGMRFLDFPFTNSLSEGRYWMAYGVSSTTSTQGTAAFSAARLAFTNLGISQINNTFGFLGSALNASINLSAGSVSVAGGGTSASLNISQISSSASHNNLFFQIIRIT